MKIPSLNNFSPGISLLEVLVAISILSVGALAVTHSALNSYVLTKRTIRHSIAIDLANTKLEELSAIDPATLDATDDLTETSLTVDNISFSRVTTVTVNPDDSRTVSVTVSGNQSSFGGAASLTDTFALWGNT